MLTKNKEKYFRIEIIASIIENRAFATLNEILSFCSFITGENVSMNNMPRILPIVTNLIIEQYPNMNYKLCFSENHFLNQFEVNEVVNKYKELYGKQIKIKSLKKQVVKVLKIQKK